MDFEEGIQKLYSNNENLILEILNNAIQCPYLNELPYHSFFGVHTGFYFYMNIDRYMVIYNTVMHHWVFQQHPNTLPIYPLGLSMKYNTTKQSYEGDQSCYRYYQYHSFAGESFHKITKSENGTAEYIHNGEIVTHFEFKHTYVNHYYVLNNWERIPRFERKQNKFCRIPYHIESIAKEQSEATLLQWINNALNMNLLYYDNDVIKGNIYEINKIRDEHGRGQMLLNHLIYRYPSINFPCFGFFDGFSRFLNKIGINVTMHELAELVYYINTLEEFKDKLPHEILIYLLGNHKERLNAPFYSLYEFIDEQKTIAKNEKFSIYFKDKDILLYLAFLHTIYSKNE